MLNKKGMMFYVLELKKMLAYVEYKKYENTNIVSCRLLESEDIPNKRLLYVLRLNEGDILPHYYILKM